MVWNLGAPPRLLLLANADWVQGSQVQGFKIQSFGVRVPGTKPGTSHARANSRSRKVTIASKLETYAGSSHFLALGPRR